VLPESKAGPGRETLLIGEGESPGPARRAPGSVSVVIPAFNESQRLGTSLPLLREGLAIPDAEVIVVDDGSTDATARVASAHLAGWNQARVVHLPWNQGKGGALRVGVALARGDVTIIMDADLSADLCDVPRLLAPLEWADIVIGSRMAAGSRVAYTSSSRQVSSRVFNTVACLMTGVAASDTQCGFKAFRSPVAKLLFQLTKTQGFAMDVEILALAQLLGFPVAEVPVTWVEVAGSTVRPARDLPRMVRDLRRTRKHLTRAARYLVGSDESTPRQDYEPTSASSIVDLREHMLSERDGD
jgi:dolichyl-phosphate beta-glucosyltransferase